jgi:hypothetical protein
MTPETQAKIQMFRQKSREGTITTEELREALAIMREDRVGAQTTSTASRTKKAAKAAINSDDLLGELDSL